MQLGKRPRRVVAATLLTILLTNTVAPTVTYALTSGPTAPEATSFEPVDTTDMVNLQTGDFTYNIPLLEVPGPEGGYPLSLSYHAGIQPNEDASWVGLGWTLNPGAITRNVSGYPDDWKGVQNSSQVYWSGGSVSTYQVGINIGISNSPVSVSFGLSFSHDTNRGFSTGLSLGFAGGGLGAQINENGALFSANLGMIQASTDLRSVSLSAGHSLGLGSLGASLSTDGNSSFSTNGVGVKAQVSSSKQAGIQTSSNMIGIQLFGFLSIGMNKTRYWTNEISNITAHGSLNLQGLAWPMIDNVAYDTYSLLEDPSVKNIVDYPDPTVLQGGGFPDFDNYNVNAQGLNGDMRPYLFQGEVLGQRRRKDVITPQVLYYSPGSDHPQPQFRFIGDFSNSYTQSMTNNYSYGADLLNTTPSFATPSYGAAGEMNGYFGNKLAGSRHIDIGVKVKPSNILGYNYDNDLRHKDGMIKGFSITNASGVTYHYGLPAYSWAEENYQERVTRPNNQVYFNRSNKPEPYAYTWYLTSITGPDFVDRNGDGKAGDGDWGYWTNFEYGKWSNNYVWRNPSEGFHSDEDANFKNCSMGRKEVYYLNAIRTRSHIALFEKENRHDGKGASPAVFQKNSPNPDYANGGLYDINSSQSLKLNKIYLLNVADANVVLPTSGINLAYQPVGLRSILCNDCEIADNVLDKTDVDLVGRSLVESKSLKIIDFQYDFSLCEQTTNSFNIDANTTVKYGKLTLKQLISRGKGGANLIPPTKFEYDLAGDDVKSQQGVILKPGQFLFTTNGSFEKGDLIMIEGSPDQYGGVIIDKTIVNGGYRYVFTSGMTVVGEMVVNIYTTKNPPYFKGLYYDSWGFYKSDGSMSVLSNPNLGRITSENSSKAVDVWSLRKIITPLGGQIKVAYESDSYRQSALVSDRSFVAFQFGSIGATDIEYGLYTGSLGGNNLADMFIPGEEVDLVAMQFATYYPTPNTAGRQVARILDSRNFSSPVTIQSVNPGNFSVVLHCNDFPSILHTDRNGYFQENGTAAATGGLASYQSNLPPRWVNFSIGRKENIPGGGLRVKSIAVVNATDNSVVTTRYDYNIPESSTSGVTTYEPTGLSLSPFDAPYSATTWDHMMTKYKRTLHTDLNSLYGIVRELPTAGVMYEYVTTRTEIKNVDEQEPRQFEGFTQYQFEVFRENMVGRQPLGGWTSSDDKSINLVLHKFNAAIGQPKSIIQFNPEGKKISEVINHYLHDGLENLSLANFMDQYKTRLAQQPYRSQGFMQERYSEVKRVSNQVSSTDNGDKATMSGREEYPCIRTGQTTINYTNGIQASTEIVGFDFYSGAVTKTVTADGYGNRFMTEIVPAYKKYGEMGIMVETGSNKNMLTQEAGTFTYKVDGSGNKLGLVSGAATTWSKDGNVLDPSYNTIKQDGTGSNGRVWRPNSIYAWMPAGKTADGLTAIGSFTDFNWLNPTGAVDTWKKVDEMTLYDVYSHQLEMRDINDNYMATKMGYKDGRVLISGGPAKYNDLAFCGAEDNMINGKFGGNVSPGDGTVLTSPALPSSTTHTGTKSLRVSAGQTGFTYVAMLQEFTPYIASVWVKSENGAVPSAAQLNATWLGTNTYSATISSKQANGWYLIQLIFTPIPDNPFYISCKNTGATNLIFDDLQFRPLNAVTNAYVYDPFSGELLYMLDRNNLYTRYEYDGMGRVVRIFKEKMGQGEIKTNEYNYYIGQ